MASRNTVRQYDTDAVYHIYNRGVERRQIFKDRADYKKFLEILSRYLDASEHSDALGRAYDKHDSIQVWAYCLMPNHFHLLVHQNEDPQAFTKLLRSISTAYTMYFNRKYKRVGHLFQERFKAARITQDDYYQHISRYIHLNPTNPFTYEWSSLQYYLGSAQSDWVHPEDVLGMFKDADEYAIFLRDYREQAAMLEKLKHELADA